MTTMHKGSCLCGHVSFEIEGAFQQFFLCHCKYCQKDTGSAHGANLFSTSASIQWLSGIDNIQTFTVPSSRHVKSFCKTCGSALPNLQMDGNLLVVPAGSLDGEVDMQPDAHLFLGRKANWDNALDDLPGFERLPE